METKKQTAVNWLHQKLATSSQEELVENINFMFMQAKAIEKEQIMLAHLKGYMNIDGQKTEEQYYKETYNQ